MIWDEARFVATRQAWNRQTPDTFWARVDQSSDGCWEWQGATNSTGYGSVGWYGRIFCAHRVAAWLSGLVDDPAQPRDRKGPGHVLHRCDNRRCCRPDHFEIGTYSRNQKDAYARGGRVAPRSTNKNAKLTPDQVRDLRAKASPNYAALGREYGVGETTIANVIKGRTYADVG